MVVCRRKNNPSEVLTGNELTHSRHLYHFSLTIFFAVLCRLPEIEETTTTVTSCHVDQLAPHLVRPSPFPSVRPSEFRLVRVRGGAHSLDHPVARVGCTTVINVRSRLDRVSSSVGLRSYGAHRHPQRLDGAKTWQTRMLGLFDHVG